jgi:hypothetical protein
MADAKKLFAMREIVETVHMDANLEACIVALVHAKRADRRAAIGSSTLSATCCSSNCVVRESKPWIGM